MKFQIRPILVQQQQHRRPAAVTRLYGTGQRLPARVTSASELHSWFGLNINLIYMLISRIKWVELSVVVVYYYY